MRFDATAAEDAENISGDEAGFGSTVSNKSQAVRISRYLHSSSPTEAFLSQTLVDGERLPVNPEAVHRSEARASLKRGRAVEPPTLKKLQQGGCLPRFQGF